MIVDCLNDHLLPNEAELQQFLQLREQIETYSRKAEKGYARNRRGRFANEKYLPRLMSVGMATTPKV